MYANSINRQRMCKSARSTKKATTEATSADKKLRNKTKSEEFSGKLDVLKIFRKSFLI